MGERTRPNPQPKDSSYVAEEIKFSEAFRNLNAGIAKAAELGRDREHAGLHLQHERRMNDRGWMETLRESGIPQDQVLELLGHKRHKTLHRPEQVAFSSIVGQLIEPQDADSPLEEKYYEFAKTFRDVTSGLEKANKEHDDKEYVSLLRLREKRLSDFDWMEALREADFADVEIVTLFEAKEDRKKIAERVVFEEIIQGSGDPQS